MSEASQTTPIADVPDWLVAILGAQPRPDSPIEKVTLHTGKYGYIGDVVRHSYDTIDLRGRCDAHGCDTLAWILETASVSSRLSKIVLADNPIDDEGAIRLADVLTIRTDLVGLEVLDLSNTRVGDQGRAALARATTRSAHLIRLEIWY